MGTPAEPYYVLSCVWLVYVAVWIFNTWKFKKEKYIPLHLLLGVLLVFRMLISFLYLFQVLWGETGLPTKIALKVLICLFQTVYYIMFFTMILLVSKGWCILRKHVVFYEKRVLALLYLGIIGSEIFRIFYDQFYTIAFVVLHVILLRLVFVNLERNSYVLHNLRRYFQVMDDKTSPLYKKRQLLTIFKITFLIYVVVKAALLLLTYFVSTQTVWIYYMVDQFIEFGLYGVLCYFYRMRKFPNNDLPTKCLMNNSSTFVFISPSNNYLLASRVEY